MITYLTDTGCEINWLPYHGNRYYAEHDSNLKKTFDEARTACQLLGNQSDLASMSDINEYNFVYNISSVFFLPIKVAQSCVPEMLHKISPTKK